MSAPKVWDLFMFRDELDMLEVRLREFEDLDVVHCLVEAPIDHRGHPKPLHYAENMDRFSGWGARVFPVIAGDLPWTGNPWVTEHVQRDLTWQAVAGQVADDDVVLLADVDEFPSHEALEGTYPVAALSQKLCMYAVDWLVPAPHVCSVVASGRYMRGRQASTVRDGRYGYHTIQDAGMHMTWLGGIQGQREKLQVTCHSADDGAVGEMRPDEIERISSGLCYNTGIHHAGDLWLTPVNVDASWPRAIFERKVPPSWFRPRETQ